MMAESCIIEIYENESFHRTLGWQAYTDCPYVMKATMAPCKPIEEITVPSSEWGWSTNWKIVKMPGATDHEGWEYASRFSRFKAKNRAPKNEARWSRARRRLWTRIMRREPAVKTTDMNKILAKVQSGLTSIHSARVKIEEIMRQAPEAATSEQMRSLVSSVERNINDILSVLDQADQQVLQQQQSSQSNGRGGGVAASPLVNGKTIANTPAVLKKLRNDVLKEQAKIEQALEGNNSSNTNNTNGKASSSSSSSMAIRNGGGASFSRSSSLAAQPYNGSGGVLNSSSNSNNPFGNNSYRASFTIGNSQSISGRNGSFMGVRGPAPPTINEDGGDSSNGRSYSTEIRQDLKGLQHILPTGNKPSVRSGNAGAFNPSMFANSRSNSQMRTTGGEEPEDGDFIDRVTHEQLIERRLIPIDEVTVMQEIIEDRSVEIEKIHKGLVEINDMFTDLSRIVKEQEEDIGQIYGNVEESHAKTQEAFNNIIAANRLQQSGNCVIC